MLPSFLNVTIPIPSFLSVRPSLLDTIHIGDCLEVMNRIPDGSVDMVLCDLPYGTTQNKWDSVIPFAALWAQYNRIVKPNGAIVLFAQTPFDKALGASNMKDLKYEWIWRKNVPTGHLNAKRSPMKEHENILVFYKKPPTYRPIWREGKPYKVTLGKGVSTNYGSQNRDGMVSESDGKNYPRSILDFDIVRHGDHPTQKPVALCEYLIKTYTLPGQTVLDNCIGSGTTAIAAINAGRRFIGIEQDPEIHSKAIERIRNHNAPHP